MKDKKHIKANLQNIFSDRNLHKRKKIDEYKKLTVTQLVGIILGQNASYDRLRGLYADMSLENYDNLRKIDYLDKRVRILKTSKNTRTFKFIDKQLKKQEEDKNEK